MSEILILRTVFPNIAGEQTYIAQQSEFGRGKSVQGTNIENCS